MNNMKLSDNTLTILKNFAGINNSILVKEGNRLRTISVAKNILAEADIKEEFPATLLSMISTSSSMV